MQQAFLEVRVFPWRPRRRAVKADDVRDAVSSGDPFAGADDLAGVVLSLAVWLLVLVAAPLVAAVVVWLLLPAELLLLLVLAVLVPLVRLAGVVPWTVLVLAGGRDAETRERYRNLLTARRRVRELNGGAQSVPVRWAWA
ncbi:MAG TPA: hypothetical protein VFV40_05560 [Nocardioides sp.]|nr:hypothetical protein [Nocardioides sp.]